MSDAEPAGVDGPNPMQQPTAREKPMSGAVPAGEPKRAPPWTNVVLLVVIALAVYLIFQFRPFGSPNPESHPAVGHPLAVLELKALVGTTEDVRLADVQGKVVLLNYWGPWCGPCREELPRLAAMAEKFRNRSDFRFLLVACPLNADSSLQSQRDDAAATLKELGVEWPCYADPTGVNRSALLTAGPPGEQESFAYPTTVVVDRHGVIRGVWIGAIPGQEKGIEDMLGRLLGSAGGHAR